MRVRSVRVLALACALSAPTFASTTARADSLASPDFIQLAQQTPPPRPASPPPAMQKLPPLPPGTVILSARKKAQQSSVGFGGTADRAVDGNFNGIYAANSVSHTAEKDPSPWWEVDLGGTFVVREIRIHNRTDCCMERLGGAVVMASDKPFVGNPTQAVANDGVLRMRVGPAPFQIVPVNRPARFVRVQLPGPGFLHLAEVAVIGPPAPASPPPTAQKFPPLPPGTVDLSLKKKVRQSSVGYGGVPERAADGNPNGVYAANSVSHTAEKDPSPWWEVDLGGSFIVREIRIHNRTDCCTERLGGAVVMVSDKPFAGNQVQAAKDGIMRMRAGPAPFQIIPINRPARFVRVQLPGPGFLHLAEVAVIGPSAQAKPPTPTAGAKPATPPK